MRKLSLVILILLVLGVTLTSRDVEARRRRKKHAAQKIINEKKLYERLGGNASVVAIVDEWVRLGLSDNRVSGFFSALKAKPDRLGRFRHNLSQQICEIADGPCQYSGADLRKVHAPMNIGDDQFLYFSEDLYKSLLKFNIAEREKNELMARVGELKDEIESKSMTAPNAYLRDGPSGSLSASATQ